jgi:hypothetical protein
MIEKKIRRQKSNREKEVINIMKLFSQFVDFRRQRFVLKSGRKIVERLSLKRDGSLNLKGKLSTL